MGRWLFNGAALTSLALCLLVLWTWNDSRSRMYLVGVSRRFTLLSIVSQRGEVTFIWNSFRTRQPTALHRARAEADAYVRAETAFSVPRGSPFRALYEPTQPPVPVALLRAMVVPHWSLVMLTLLLPLNWLAVYLHRQRQRQRIQAGRCARCGYDLRATRRGVCPECGSAVPRAPQTEMNAHSSTSASGNVAGPGSPA